MLGIRAAHKDDLGASPVKIVFDIPLALSCQFQDLSRTPASIKSFIRDLKEAMSYLKPTPTSAHNPTVQEHIPEALRICPFAPMRCDKYKVPLTVKYDGPYRVREQHLKFFKVEIGDNRKREYIYRSAEASGCPAGHQTCTAKEAGETQEDRESCTAYA